MTPDESDRESPANAEALFAEFVARREGGEELDFEQFCAENAAHATLLRQYHAAWARVRGVLDRLGSSGSLAGRTQREDAPELEEPLSRPGPAHADSPVLQDPELADRPGRSGISFFGRQKASPHPSLGVAPGRVLGDFRLIETIGQGGMGQIWAAEQVSLRRRVALKLVRPDRVTTRTLDLFAREARAGGRLHHRGIVDVHAHGESEGVAWIAMELVEGSWTVRDFMDDVAKVDELPGGYYRDVAVFVAKIADALHAAHGAGVIHRDLKPQNILITPDDEPKVTDFGLARITDETALSVTGDFAGTYMYMSPEQVAAKRPGLDHRTDVFSLGIVLYELLARRRPFEGDTTHQVAEQILFKDPPDLRSLRSRIPGDLAVICGKCLEKDREHRYASMADLAADIRRHLADEPIVARPPGRLRKLQLWTRRNPAKSASSAVAGVAFVAIALLLVENMRANRDLRHTVRERDGAIGALDAEVAAVKRLSALQDYDELVTEVDGLWPPHAENVDAYVAWIAAARELVRDLPLHYEKREELREAALPQSAEEREAERRSHPDSDRLQWLVGAITARRTALAQRRDGIAAEEPELDWSAYPDDASALKSRAWPLVRPRRETLGREGEGLALARRAMGLAQAALDDELVAKVGNTLSWALFAVGRDEEALEAGEAALSVAPGAKRAEYEGYLSVLEAWVDEARSDAGLRQAEAQLALLESEREQLEARVNARREWSFPDTEEGREVRWWHANLERLIEGLEGLEDEKTGLLSESADAVSLEHGWSVPRRLAFAQRMRDGLAAGGEWDERWKEAIAAIGVQPDYGGLTLARQEGLVPIGTDPDSGLWEFWHVATGTEPVRGVDRRLVPTEETGLVLVLVPGGSFWMGAQSTNPSGHDYDEQAEGDEDPVHQVILSAYFLSKYEMTQGQWTRFAGRNPSAYGPDGEWFPNWLEGGAGATYLSPVEQVTWLDCMRELPRMGLGLPSEAQWERACRGGRDTDWPWWTGESEETLRGAANLVDTYARDNGGGEWPDVEEWLNDGATVHAPVGTYLPNGLGLHDVHGNVWEWCLDAYDPEFYSTSPKRDPVAPWAEATLHVARGGGCHRDAAHARSARRGNYYASDANGNVGVRPGKALSE